MHGGGGAPSAGGAEGRGRRKAGWRVGALIGWATGELLLSTRGTETKQCGARLDERQNAGRAGVQAHRAGRLAGDGMKAGASRRAAAGCGAAGQGSSPAKCAAEQSNDKQSVRESGRSVPVGIAGTAREFYKTNIAACQTDGTSRKMLDYCRCRLQRECDSRVQPLAPSGKARTEVHSGALAFHAYAGRDCICQDDPVRRPASAARRSAQSQYLDAQTLSVLRRLPCSVLLLLPRSPRPRPSRAATSTATVRVC